MRTRIIFFTGGVYSSIGKGITLANIGRIFKELNFKISALKLDPYLNLNSGNLSPSQHGEVYVTSDGHECDLDLGHYERFIGCELSRDSCVTAGTVYNRILLAQDSGAFPGHTVQIVPHVINEIHRSIYALLDKDPDLDFLLVEIGGTVGDIESQPFLEAAHRLKKVHGRENILFIHISPIFFIKSAQEFKTKPTQHSIKELQSHSISPDILILRSELPLPGKVRAKLSAATQIDEGNIIECIDSSSVYLIAESLYSHDIHGKILKYFNMPQASGDFGGWRRNTGKILAPKEHSLRVAIVGKYSAERDSYMSINESLLLASYDLGIDLRIDYISSDELSNEADLGIYGAICVPHGFGERGVEGKIRAIRYCRENGIPFLGICFGMQLACIEYMRNVLNEPKANSIELDPDTSCPLFIALPGADMRLGSYPIRNLSDTRIFGIFGREKISMRHRHRYYLNGEYFSRLGDGNFIISSLSDDDLGIVESVELRDHPFFLATQYHPEFSTRFFDVPPIFSAFLRAGIRCT